MEHRDVIILQKVLSELQIAENMMGQNTLEAFLSDEMLKRAICMTVINIGKIFLRIAGENIRQFPGRLLPVSGTLRRISTRHCAWKTCMRLSLQIFQHCVKKLSKY